MASVDGRYVGPLDVSDAQELVSAIKEDRAVLPGRGLEDSDYRPPWQDGGSSPQPPGQSSPPDPSPA